MSERGGNWLARAKRLVVKIGSSLLVDETTGRIRKDWLDALADDVALMRAEGKQVILVSSGAIAVGRRHLALTQKNLRLEEKQAAAAGCVKINRYARAICVLCGQRYVHTASTLGKCQRVGKGREV